MIESLKHKSNLQNPKKKEIPEIPPREPQPGIPDNLPKPFYQLVGTLQSPAFT